MSTKPDDLEAVRNIVTALQPFSADEQERIIRWSREKLNLATSPASSTPSHSHSPTPAAAIPQPAAGAARKDIKTFVSEKNPTSDKQFAAVVAYFYAFEAPEGERKESIGSDDLQEACRKAGRARLGDPGQTLRNACFAGLLDKAGDRGAYKINSVGENLVAMTLPGQSGAPNSRKPAVRKVTKRSVKK